MNVRLRRYRSAWLTLSIAGLFAAIAFTPSLDRPVAAAHEATPQSPAPVPTSVDFDRDISPILVNHCYDCHSAATRSAGGLRLDDRNALLKGGRSGAAVVPGKPDESLLLKRVLSTDTKLRMPKGEDDPLAEKDVAALRSWIAQGAQWSAPKSAASAGNAGGAKAAGKPVVKKVAYPRPATPEQLAYFEKNVRPILVNRCYNCHSDAFKEAGGLRVDVGISIFAGGNSGPVIIPGHPEKSLLIERVKSTDTKKRMPQESQEALPDAEVAILERWIQDGAAWPDETEKLPATPARLLALYPKLKANHWSWQPLTDPAVPVASDNNWSSTKIDGFVLAKLHEKKLAPVSDADPDTLVRRLSYDLTGLPPTPTEVKAFEADHSERAYEQLVDRLLASPRYGERWGRHWLDVARYAESSGPSRNMPYPNAWRYRDYVIDAYNRDVPYNRFIEEQIAGDLLPAATPAEHDRLLIATGYLALGPKDVNQRFKARYKMDNVDDEIDTVTRGTMGMTVACARCHDHKFDPIPTKDYYALAGIFTSTEDDTGLTSKMGGSSLDYYDPKHFGYLSSSSDSPEVSEAKVKRLQAKVKELKKKLDAMNAAREAALKEDPKLPPLSPKEKRNRQRLQKELIDLRENAALINDKGEHGYGVHSVRDGVVEDTSVRVRGVEERHGPTVPRGFLTVLNLPNTQQIPASHSGRLELAEWIARVDNPLTTRVYVNRIWQHLFGIGIVGTLDNFGVTGDTPSNPELLDYLANDFVRNGWSTKKLVREIVLTRAYRLGSEAPPEYKAIDPQDRYVWRHAPRRLESEEIRDSVLATSGQLDLTPPQGSPAMALRMIEVRDDGPAVASILSAADRSRYRSIYLPLLRDETPRALEAFDPVSQTLVTGQRDETTVPGQALFLLNSPFVRAQSLGFARALLASKNTTDAQRIGDAYERIAGRAPTANDEARAERFLASYSDAWTRSHPGQKKKLHTLLVAAQQPMTSGVIREDGLTQDDAVDTAKPSKQETDLLTPSSSHEAAWAAFVQSLYGSAAFQFVR